MEFGVEVAALLFGVAAIAGCIDTIAGGGGLIALPMMLIVGVPPASALATNKLQGSGGTFTASLYFLRKKTVRLRDNWVPILTTFFGSVVGVWLVLQMDSSILAKMIPFLLIVMGSYFALSPNLGAVDSKRRVSSSIFSAFVTPVLGFYDGFFGPGAGMFMTLSFVSLCGYNLTKATAHTKLLNCTSNVAALLYFVLFGEIFWKLGLVMLCGQFLGSYIGARMVFSRGAALIRPVVTTMCFAMAFKLLFDSYVATRMAG
ncbi:MAG: TSUP family transporter [Elainellaceae cyanobacterium]